MQALVVPERSLQQRTEALAQGNRVRLYRARAVKPKLKARQLGLFDALDDPQCKTMKVRDVLLSLPGLGQTKVDLTMRRADIAPAKTCAGITVNQRTRLARTLADHFPRTPIVFRAPEADSIRAVRNMGT